MRAVNAPKWPELPDYRIIEDRARTGERIVAVETAGRTYHIESRYDPSADAARFVENLNPKDGELIVLVGGGRRAVDAILGISAKFVFVYLEPFPELRGELDVRDPRIHIAKDPRELCDILRNADVAYLERLRFELYPALKPVIGEYARSLADRCRKVFEERISEVMTYSAVGRIVVENILSNIPSFSQARPVRALFSDRETGVFCVVGSGPSLDRAAPEIYRVRSRMCVVAVDSAASPLLAHGIEPDIVVSLDPRVDVAEHMSAVPEDVRWRIPWVMCSSVHPRVWRQLRGCRRFVFAGDHPIDTWLAGRWGEPGTLALGGSVILPAFDLACRMGAQEIVLAGADFSFGEGYLSHSRGASGFQQNVSGVDRFSPLETNLYKDAAGKAPRVVREGGRAIRTGDNLLTYCRHLGSMVRRFRGHVYQLNAAVPVDGAISCETLRDLENRPIMNIREGVESPGAGFWVPASAAGEAQEDVRRRLVQGISTDLLFRTAVEAEMFRRARQTRDSSADVWTQVAAGVAEQMREFIEREWEEG